MDHAPVSELEKINKSETVYNTWESKENFCSENETQAPLRRQTLVCMGTFMMTLGAGATAGFSAILIPQLQNSSGGRKYSIEMISWLASISSFALVFGNLLSGYLMERFGRRKSQLILSIFFILGWVLIGLSREIIYIILAGRFITGLCQGWLGPLGPVFVGEISTPIHRGFFLAALSLAIATGVLLSHFFGTMLHWSTASILCGSFPLIGGIILYYAPESPAWLASKNRIEECIVSFQWYRGNSLEMRMELDKMIDEQTKKDKTKGKLESLQSNIKEPQFWKPLLIMILFFLTTQLSGVNVICAYTTDMMKELIGENNNKSTAYIAMLSIDVLRCVSLCFACVLLRKLGRRPLALFSGIFTSTSLITLAVYLYLVSTNHIRNLSPFISLGLIAFYIIVSNLGISPLPWNMVGEVFATETKGLGSGISVMMTSIAFFATIKTAPAMFHSIGHHGTYLFYGVSTLIGTTFLFFCLPETKGKTLLQIEEYFRGNKTEKVKDDFKKNPLLV
ncbi:facilitated trehalose transporter Tret1-like [Achroia grisella]|uniref:facilitated trehalose transporter Tret1-like n=1 Tax=Achroia grisella TaxID=688607 RepID=UPI0027D34BD8|nr:facilitated trehalose transporter Tret1-like [Achroia grisella]